MPIAYADIEARETRDRILPAIYERSGGRLKINPFVHGEHPYPKEDMLQILRDNVVEMSWASGGYLAGVEPQLTAIELPLLLPPDADLIGAIHKEVFDTIYRPVYDKWNAQEVITMFWPYQRMGANVPLKDWDSLKGKKIRVWSAELNDMIGMMGGIGMNIAHGEVPAALAAGLIDGLITNSGGMYDLGTWETLDYLNLIDALVSLPSVFVSKDALAALPPDLQQIFLDTWRGFEDFERRNSLSVADEKALRAAKEYNVTITAPSPAFRAELVERAQAAIWDGWVERAGPVGQEALDAILAAKAKVLAAK